MITLETELYITQLQQWPKSGRHIMGQFDDNSIIVYQAYNPSIANYAVQHQKFGGHDFSWTRMTWIKTNFTWMMYRSGWATKPNQERILAIKLSRQGFEEILSEAVLTSLDQFNDTSSSNIKSLQKEWKQQLNSSQVRLQWDPDHNLLTEKMQRRAIQLGLKGDVLKKYSNEWIISIEDITEFVSEQYELVKLNKLDEVRTPVEQVYELCDNSLKGKLGMINNN
nr:12065_t:CDS:2 [Entrophospora candida]